MIDEAIESCPVDCIHYVSFEDLVIIENERLAREGTLDFNNYASFKKGWTGQDNAVPETKAKFYGSLAQGNRCNNCPSRGCASCPMFGVGQNPIYAKRKAEREARKQASGQAAREAADAEAQRRIDILFGRQGAGDTDAAASVGSVGASPLDDESVLNAIFGDYSFETADEGGDSVLGVVAPSSSAIAPSSSEIAAKEQLRKVLDDGAVEGLDPYAVLGVARDAPLPEIRRAFRRLAMRWHPDRCARLPEVERLQAELIFKQVNLAHEVLTDEAKRRQYDGGTDLADLIVGFWERLTSRMSGAAAERKSVDAGGVVVPVGSGLALSELAEEEELDSGLKAPLLLGAFSADGAKPEDGVLPSADLAADGTEKLPGVRYDAWGRPMA